MGVVVPGRGGTVVVIAKRVEGVVEVVIHPAVGIVIVALAVSAGISLDIAGFAPCFSCVSAVR